MRSDSLTELINRFVFYKRDNGYQYQTGAPDKKGVEGFLEKIQDTSGSLYNTASFLRKFSRYLIACGLL